MSGFYPRPVSTKIAEPLAILIVNPDLEIRHLVEKSIPNHRQVTFYLAWSDELDSLDEVSSPDLVLLNLKAEVWPDLTELWKICGRWPGAQIIFLSPLNDIHLWAEAIRLGAYDFLPRSIDPDQLQWVLQGAFGKRRVLVDGPAAHVYREAATR